MIRLHEYIVPRPVFHAGRILTLVRLDEWVPTACSTGFGKFQLYGIHFTLTLGVGIEISDVTVAKFLSRFGSGRGPYLIYQMLFHIFVRCSLRIQHSTIVHKWFLSFIDRFYLLFTVATSSMHLDMPKDLNTLPSSSTLANKFLRFHL
jgi:hypothetical protein